MAGRFVAAMPHGWLRVLCSLFTPNTNMSAGAPNCCSVCLDAPIVRTLPPRRSMTRGCQHAVMCETCLVTFVRIRLREKKVVECSACREKIPPVLIRDIAELSAVELERYTLLYAPSGVEVWRCPAASCGYVSALSHAPAPDAQRPDAVLCPDCDGCFCRRCGSDSATGHSSSKECKAERTQYDAWLQLNARAESEFGLMLANGRLRRCPNTRCNVPIEKNGGCSHMYCTRCGISFTWA